MLHGNRLFARWLLLASAMGLLACAPTPTIWQDSPATWGDEHKAALRTAPLLGYNSVCSLASRQAHGLGVTAAGEMISVELRRRGMSKRDVEILLDPKSIYGTGMSVAGLECAANSRLIINKSFYPGAGHQWQARFGSGFVYLRGDGTRAGMKVYAWN